MSAAGRGLTDEEMDDLLSVADTQGPDGTDDQPAEEAGPGPEALERAQRGSIADAVAAGTHADDDPLDSDVTDDGIVEISDDDEQEEDDDMSHDDESDLVGVLREQIAQLRTEVLRLGDENEGLTNDKDQLRERITQLEGMIETLQANNNDLRRQLNRSRNPRQRTQRVRLLAPCNRASRDRTDRVPCADLARHVARVPSWRSDGGGVPCDLQAHVRRGEHEHQEQPAAPEPEAAGTGQRRAGGRTAHAGRRCSWREQRDGRPSCWSSCGSQRG